MKILLALILGLALTGVQANPLLDDQGAVSGFEVDIKGQGYSLYDQRIAVLRALVNRKWVVIEQTASRMVAQYESKAKIAVDLTGDTISVSEVQGGFIPTKLEPI